MKKFFIFIFSIFFNFFLSAQNSNLIFSEYYNYENLQSIEIFSQKVPIKTEKYSGDSILIEITGNNKKYLPEISTENNKLSIIFKNDFEIPKGNYLSLVAYLPVNFNPKQINLSSEYSDLIINYCPDSESIILNSSTGSISICNSKTSELNISSIDANIIVAKVKCEYFFVCSYGKADINFFLENEPIASSQIQTETGNINFGYTNQNLDNINIFSKKGKILIQPLNY